MPPHSTELGLEASSIRLRATTQALINGSHLLHTTNPIFNVFSDLGRVLSMINKRALVIDLPQADNKHRRQPTTTDSYPLEKLDEDDWQRVICLNSPNCLASDIVPLSRAYPTCAILPCNA